MKLVHRRSANESMYSASHGTNGMHTVTSVLYCIQYNPKRVGPNNPNRIPWILTGRFRNMSGLCTMQQRT